MAVNQNPREALAGWHLYPRAGWTLLALNLLVPAAAWLPVDWAGLRAFLMPLGCFAGGMLIASRGAIWQRTDESLSAAYPEAASTMQTVTGEAREALTGWRTHPAAARILLVLALGGMVVFACGPKEWLAVRAAALVLACFAAGALAARDAAIWQRTSST